MIARAGLAALWRPSAQLAQRYMSTRSPPPASIYSPPHALPPPPSASVGEPPRPAEEDLLELGLRPGHFGPRPEDIPPISERLRPLIPFILVWTFLTSLLMHRWRVRKQGEADRDRSEAQESVLRGLIERFVEGQVVEDIEIRRELEMVRLRPRTAASAGLQVEEMRDVSWVEVFRGRKEQREAREKHAQEVEAGGEEAVAEEWRKLVAEATADAPAPEASDKATDSGERSSQGVVRRAKSASVYM
ncbi:hypothetical protein CspHIS471_0204880 [Cutaneotrichosporon sp. HIS471]|nr:hypothetical protein CspHIS471_0204880 [Cutaneotrichosporon sp. HIS471]